MGEGSRGGGFVDSAQFGFMLWHSLQSSDLGVILLLCSHLVELCQYLLLCSQVQSEAGKVGDRFCG